MSLIFHQTDRKKRNGEPGLMAEYMGKLYVINTEKNDVRYWKCKNYKSHGCRAKIRTENQELKSASGAHHCGDDAMEIKRRVYKNKLKEEIRKNPNLGCRKAYEKVKQELFESAENEAEKEATAAMFPDWKSCQTSLYREKSSFQPPIPKSLAELTIDDEWTMTLDGSDLFLQVDEGGDDRILIFCKMSHLKIVAEAEVAYVDGTCKSCPQMFAQLYTIHAYYLGEMFPLIYAFMPNRTINTYKKLFQHLIDKCQQNGFDFKPKVFQIDFEQAAIGAIAAKFPDSRIRGSYFHFSQAIWRKVQEIGATDVYQSNEEFERFVKKLATLPLIPWTDEELDLLYQKIISETPTVLASVPIMLSYFERAWYGIIGIRFNRNLWNHDDDDGPRTVNNLEAWHSRINGRLTKIHPNIWDAVRLIQEETNNVDIEIMALRTTRSPKPLTSRYRHLQRILTGRREQLELGQISGTEFIDSMKYHITFSD